MNIRPAYTTDEQARISRPVRCENEIGQFVRDYRTLLSGMKDTLDIVKAYGTHCAAYATAIENGYTGADLALPFELKWSAWRELQARLDPVVAD